MWLAVSDTGSSRERAVIKGRSAGPPENRPPGDQCYPPQPILMAIALAGQTSRQVPQLMQ
jgi:hypothetical protein